MGSGSGGGDKNTEMLLVWRCLCLFLRRKLTVGSSVFPCVTSAPEWRGMLGIAAHSSHVPGFASLATLQDAF